ncbi:hypothetical protein JEQ12_017147 [Ovis aries]|uniref:Bcl-2-like protein 1 n=1 Tax=Ovis aries TaxID=9940 RepID=A0A836ADK7_SHEEP|nr:hypothetical protein JEQ12_017147 [Ovis aries]
MPPEGENLFYLVSRKFDPQHSLCETLTWCPTARMRPWLRTLECTEGERRNSLQRKMLRNQKESWGCAAFLLNSPSLCLVPVLFTEHTYYTDHGGALCMESIDKEIQVLVSQVMTWMASQLNDHLEPWIQENGGWDASVEFYENKTATESQKGQERFNCWSLTAVTLAGIALLGSLFNS